MIASAHPAAFVTKLLFELSIPNPCSQPWSEMAGSDAVRHCAKCEKDVHNLVRMTARQIEELVCFSSGEVCGRITRTAEGTLVARPEVRRSRLAGMAFAAAVPLTSIAAAQANDSGNAVVSGRVTGPGEAGLKVPVAVVFSQAGIRKQSILTDSSGEWQASLPAGHYDVRVLALAQNAQLSINGVTLHEGHQSFGIMQTKEMTGTVSTTSGAVVSNAGFVRRIAYRLRHPIRYTEYLGKRYL